MTGSDPTPPDREEPSGEGRSEGGVADALRSAVERTMRATAGSASGSRERAAELVDEVVRRGREARDELARRGQEAGAGLARRGQEATGEVGRRVELLERRLAELERRLGAEQDAERPASRQGQAQAKPEAEG
jgi:polyhydroxyalkanoate synthesis regulator phasin